MSPETEVSPREIEVLRDAVAEAGALVMRHFRCDPQVWEKPGEGPVSEADLAANDLLRERLAVAFPGHGWLSEESADDEDRLARQRVWIVDPIDGTRAFIDGRPEFTVCAALAVGGEAVAGAVLNPAKDEFFLAARGRGATRNGAPLPPTPPSSFAEAQVISTRGVLRPWRWRGDPPGGRHGYVNSLAYRACKVATDRWDVAVVLKRLSEWDLAAAQIVVEEAGGKVTDRAGRAIRYNARDPKIAGLIAAAEPLHGEIVRRLLPEEEALARRDGIAPT